MSLSDSSQRYALYLPSYYDPGSNWPVLFLLDPRGRAVIPLQSVVTAAERHGYVVLSSYNSRSDVVDDRNTAAMEAMLSDVQERFSPDVRRLYIAGFSGTARAAWDYAFRLHGYVAGIMGFGGGPSLGYPLAFQVRQKGTPFAFFGGAGTTDFNFDEMWDLDLWLDNFEFVHRMRYYAGPHSWPSEPVFTEGLDWLELQAMKTGLCPPDSVAIRETFDRRLAEAQDLEASGQLYEALVRYRGIVEDFDGVLGIEEPLARLAELNRNREVTRLEERLHHYVRARGEFDRRFAEFLDDFAASRPPSLERSLETLGVPELQRRAAESSDSLGALAAQRLLERIFVQTAFYQPRSYLEGDDAERAAAMLEIAHVVKPNDPRVSFSRARAYVRLQRFDEALEMLELVAASGAIDADWLEGNPEFEPLHGEARFQAILTRLRQNRPE